GSAKPLGPWTSTFLPMDPASSAQTETTGSEMEVTLEGHVLSISGYADVSRKYGKGNIIAAVFEKNDTLSAQAKSKLDVAANRNVAELTMSIPLTPGRNGKFLQIELTCEAK